MFLSLGEVYRDPAIYAGVSRNMDIWRRGGVDAYLRDTAPLCDLDTPDALLEHVEGLPEHDWYESRYRAAQLLGSLPAKLLLDNFGEAIMAWTFANADDNRREKLGSVLEEEGYNPVLLRRATNVAWSHRQPPRGQDVLVQNRVMEAVLGGAAVQIDLDDVLQRAAVTEESLRASRLRHYSLEAVEPDATSAQTYGYIHDWAGKQELNKAPGLSYHIWIDAPTGLLLHYKGVPQAILGVAAGGQDELQIQQLQRVYGAYYDPCEAGIVAQITGYKNPRGVMVLDWQKAMVDVTARLARQLNMGSVSILSGRNVLLQPGVRLTTRQAVEMYDDTADRLGFKPIYNVAGAIENWRQPTAELL